MKKSTREREQTETKNNKKIIKYKNPKTTETRDTNKVRHKKRNK